VSTESNAFRDRLAAVLARELARRQWSGSELARRVQAAYGPDSVTMFDVSRYLRKTVEPSYSKVCMIAQVLRLRMDHLQPASPSRRPAEPVAAK